MTNGLPGNDPSHEPTRPLDDGEWFWTREAFETSTQQSEPTQVIPVTEPTVQLPSVAQPPANDMTLALSAAIGSMAASAAHPSASPAGAVPQDAPQPASWAPPAGQPVAATMPRRSGGPKALLAVLAASLLTGMAALQAPAVARTAERLPGGQSTTRPEPTQADPGSPTGEDQAGEDQTGERSQDGSGTPAEQQPWDPWGQEDQAEDGRDEEDQEEAGQGSTDERPSRSSQTGVSSAQGKGVVLIEARTASGRSAGTGMVLSEDGHVLTNYHVVQSSTSLQVQVASTHKSYQATVVGHDAGNDVALLKLEGAQGLETVRLDDDELDTGDEVTAVGNANGQGHLSAAPGKVTDMSSSITVSNETSASGKERLSDVIKTTAGAQPGDSGGPMFDEEDEVVGMTTAGQQASSGIRTQNTTIASYAVPIERAMGIINQIRSGNESGTVKIGPKAYLGVSVRTLQDGSIGVASVVRGGPADTAGLSRDDLVTSLDGTAITSHGVLSEVLAGKEPGDRVTLTWLDGSSGARRSAEVTLGSSPMN